MLQHFRGNLDDWDPLLLGALASDREVIPFDKCRDRRVVRDGAAHRHRDGPRRHRLH
jgi:hypothetical protein